MNKKLGAIAMLLSATGMGLVGTISRGTTAGLADADKSVIGSFLTFGLDLSATTPELPQKSLGDLLGLLSGVFYGLALFFYGYRKDVDSIVRGVWNFFWAACATLVMSIVLRPWHGVSTFTATNWMWAVALFLVCGLFALGFLVVAGRNLPAVEYSTISYWECPVAILCGLLV